MTPDQIVVVDQRRGLELTRARLAGELARATVAAHRAMLEQALADVDAQLGALR